MAKIAAIDMGSNAIRFYAVETTGESGYRVLENVREPIRLGCVLRQRTYPDGTVPQVSDVPAHRGGVPILVEN